MAIREPLFDEITSTDFLGFNFEHKSYEGEIRANATKTEKTCAVSVWRCQVDGVTFLRADMNFKYFGGSLGCAEGEKLTQMFEQATDQRLPVIIYSRSGGVRMQEGTVALMMMAKTSCAQNAHKQAGLPFVNVFEDPTYGGVSASYAMQADVRIGVKGTRIGFAGPNVILNTMYGQKQDQYDKACPAGFQSAQFLYDHGQLDMLVNSDEEAEAVAIKIFRLLTSTQKGAQQYINSIGELSHLSSEESTTNEREIQNKDHNRSRKLDRVQAQDIFGNVLKDFIEIRGDGQIGIDSCVHGGIAILPYIETDNETDKQSDSEPKSQTKGYPVVVIGTVKGHSEADFASAGYGMATPSGYRTALKLFNFAERFSLPVVTLVDTVGAEPSFSAERAGQSEAIAGNLQKMASLRVPIISIIVGEGGSGGALGL
ncbi:MAG: pyruvate carboxylase, partial [Streblomastix strix]